MSTLVAVELQLCGDLLFFSFHGQTNGVQHQIHRLCRSCFLSRNAVIIEVPDHGQVQYALLGVDVGDVCYPFAVRLVRMKLPVQQIFVLVYLLPHLLNNWFASLSLEKLAAGSVLLALTLLVFVCVLFRQLTVQR